MTQNITGVKETTPQPSITFRIFKCAEVTAKGNAMRHATTGDSALGGYSLAYMGMLAAVSDANTIPIGIAMHAVSAAEAAAGAYVKIQTGGLGQQTITGDGAIAAGQLIFAAAAGAVDSETLDGSDGDHSVVALGLALKADGDTSANDLDAGQYILFPFGAF